jgi:hypothetical protein
METLKQFNRRLVREAHLNHLFRMENDYEYRKRIEANRALIKLAEAVQKTAS